MKALQKSPVRKSAPATTRDPVAPQSTAIVTESLTKPSPNPSFVPDKFPSLLSSSNVHLTDEMVYAATSGTISSSDSHDHVMSEVDPTNTLVEMNVEQAVNIIPSTTDNNKRFTLFMYVCFCFDKV